MLYDGAFSLLLLLLLLVLLHEDVQLRADKNKNLPRTVKNEITKKN